MNASRILLVDDHDLVRAGLALVLKKLDGVEVIAEAGDGRQAVRLVEELAPDLVLLDIIMPSLNGIESLKQIMLRSPATKVIILSMNANEEYVMQAMRAGARGYVLKNVSPNELDTAIKTVVAGGTYLSPSVAKHVVHGDSPRAEPTRDRTSFQRLTPRQREVLQLISEGNTTKEIARKLEIGVKTVEMHRAQLMDSLDIHDVAGLVRYAIRQGIITPDS